MARLVREGFFLNGHSDGGGSVLRAPDLEFYQSNSVVAVTAVPDPGWVFLGWLGDLAGGSSNSTVLMSRDKCVQAVFGTQLIASVDGYGSIQRVPDREFYPYGSECRITARPTPSGGPDDQGFYFVQWENDVTGSVNPFNIAVTNVNPVAGALFLPLNPGDLALTFLVNGGGRVELNIPGNHFPSGQGLLATPIPDPGEEFIHWGGDAGGSQVPLIITMNRSKVITATFTSRPLIAVRPCSDGFIEDGFQFTLQGRLDGVFQVDRSSDLTEWSPLITLTNSLGKVQWLDQEAFELPRRYYRALAAP